MLKFDLCYMNLVVIITREDLRYLKKLHDLAEKAKSREPLSSFKKVLEEIKQIAPINEN